MNKTSSKCAECKQPVLPEEAVYYTSFGNKSKFPRHRECVERAVRDCNRNRNWYAPLHDESLDQSYHGKLPDD